jgi:putative DNA methylase
MSTQKKLIEVALPLEAINQESAREKSIRHGHPSTLHLWWARRPLASCRAVLFASLVDDPSARPEEFPTAAAQETERRRLMEMIERLVKWENVNDAELMAEAHAEIMKSTGGNPPPVLDPFCGGGSIPLEVQRLGLEAHASDINPVAVLITKALIEIPPRFKDLPPVNPVALKKAKISSWTGAQGLAEDVRYYGQWVRDKAQERIGHLYPKVTLSDGESEATVIAWLWARTVKCPNPACGCQMPLVKSFELSTKKGKAAWVEPVIDRTPKIPVVNFTVKTGEGKVLASPKLGRGAKFLCLACEQPVDEKHIKAEGVAKRMGAKLMAIVAEGKRGRIYLEPTKEHEKIAFSAKPTWKPEVAIGNDRRSMFTPLYGLNTFGDLFTDRQLVALTTLSDLVQHEVQAIIKEDACSAGLADDDIPLREGGTGARAYAEAISVYLAFALDRSADRGSTICSWDSSPKMEALRNTFARQAIPMTWDFAEGNLFSDSSGNWIGNLDWVAKVIEKLPATTTGMARQADATVSVKSQGELPLVFTTDPPYYDNISYAELSDFFYVWLRRCLGDTYPELFSTLATPKDQELVAAPYRFGGDKDKARQFFEDGLQKAFQQTYQASHPDYPFSVFYAFKQTETEDSADGKVTASSGWETMLEGLIRAGFSITGTWPMRTELGNRMVASGSNALASSIVLVCRPLPKDATKATRRQFLNALQRELPAALQAMQQGNIAPVDLAQASIGPGMAVFTRYQEILEPNGDRMTVRTALQLINQTLDDFLSEQEGVFDADTRWALTWYEQHQFEPGAYGDAETLSKAKVTSIQGLVNSGILAAKAGKVHLLKRSELPTNWTPDGDDRIPDWEAMQHLILHLQTHGEAAAAELLAQLGNQGDITRDLAYRLYNICDRNGWTQDAIAYNSLVTSWSEISRLAAQSRDQAKNEPKQLALV